MLNRRNLMIIVSIAFSLNGASAHACGMTGTPAPTAAPQGPAVQVGRVVENMQMSMPAVLVQTDVLNGNVNMQQQNGSGNVYVLDADGLVGWDIERDPKVIVKKIALEEAQKQYATAKNKLNRWLNKLTKQQREQLKKAEEKAAKLDKEAFDASAKYNRALGDYFGTDDFRIEQEKKFNDPKTPEKDRPTEKEIENLRESSKERKEACEKAYEKAGEIGKQSAEAEADRQKLVKEAFPGKEAEYEKDLKAVEPAREAVEQAQKDLKTEIANASKN